MNLVINIVYAQKEAFVKNIANVINYYANFHIMDVIVLKEIVVQIIVLAI